MMSFLAGLLSSSKIQDVGIDAIRKIGGLDGMDAQAKADYILNYITATKHQSVTRRFIALVMVMLFALIVLTWLISAGIGYYFNLTPALEFAGAVKMFLENVIMMPMNLVLGFYFVVNIAQKVGGK